MGWPAQERALRIRSAHGVDGVPSDPHLDAMLAAARLTVVEGCRFTGRVREVYAAGLLGIRAGLAPGWVRWLKAHGLGHHLLHHGNHLYRRGRLHLWQRHEIEAELFAGGLLFPDRAGGRPTLHELASLARVPLACVYSWQAAAIDAWTTGLCGTDTGHR